MKGGHIVAHECALHGLSGNGGCGWLGEGDREGGGLGGESALGSGGEGGLPQHSRTHN